MTTETRPRRPTLFGGVSPLPPSLAALAPEPIQTANEDFAQALDRHRAAQRAVPEARAAIEETAAEDRRLAAEASVSGKPPLRAQEPAARQKATEVERMVDAAKAVAADRQSAFVGSLLEHGDEFLASAADALEVADADATRALDSYQEAALRGDVLRRLRDQLDPDGLQGRSVTFHIRENGRLRTEQRDHLDALRGPLQPG